MTDNSTSEELDSTLIEQTQHTQGSDTDNKPKGTNTKELTWVEVLTVVIPGKLEDWAKNIFTQLRPWSGVSQVG